MAQLAQSLARAVKAAQFRPKVETSSESRNYYVLGTQFLQQRRFAEAETSLREALRLEPDNADTLNNLGTSVWEQGRSGEATAYYLRAYQLKKHDFGILSNLGMVLWDQGRPERAIEYYERALALNPHSFDTQMNLGVSLSDIGRFDDALIWLQSAARMRPSSADAWDNVGMTLARRGNWDVAMKCYDEAIRLRPDFGEAHRNRALGWLTLGDFERGFPETEWRFKCRNPPGMGFPRPRWNGEPLEGRSILLHFEQGLGDTLQFIRFAPLVKEYGGQVSLYCQPPLSRLMRLCLGVDLVSDGTAPIPDFHLEVPLMSVPAVIGTTAATLPRAPYLFADTSSIERWRHVISQALGVADLDSVFKIGIAWQGSPTNRIDRWRSFPLTWFEELAKIPGVRLVSLQKGPGVEQLATLQTQFRVTTLGGKSGSAEDARDFLDTAAVMHSMDLIITPETAVAHLAGGMGVRTWVALSTVGDWRWMDKGDVSPWYPHARLFRQAKLDDWAGLFQRMADELREELAHFRSVETAS